MFPARLAQSTSGGKGGKEQDYFLDAGAVIDVMTRRLPQELFPFQVKINLEESFAKFYFFVLH
jgi:hypothetical protein